MLVYSTDQKLYLQPRLTFLFLTIAQNLYRAPKYKRDLKKSPKTDFKRPFLNKKKTKKRPKKKTF